MAIQSPKHDVIWGIPGPDCFQPCRKKRHRFTVLQIVPSL